MHLVKICRQKTAKGGGADSAPPGLIGLKCWVPRKSCQNYACAASALDISKMADTLDVSKMADIVIILG